MHITLYTFQTQYVNTALKKKKKKKWNIYDYNYSEIRYVV